MRILFQSKPVSIRGRKKRLTERRKTKTAKTNTLAPLLTSTLAGVRFVFSYKFSLFSSKMFPSAANSITYITHHRSL